MRQSTFATGVALFLATQICGCTGVSGVQQDTLRVLPGASEDLGRKLECIKNKEYPRDIEVCGISGFPQAATLARIERCLRTGTGKVVEPTPVPGKKIHIPMLVVRCDGLRVGVEFGMEDGEYRVRSVSEIAD